MRRTVLLVYPIGCRIPAACHIKFWERQLSLGVRLIRLGPSSPLPSSAE